MPQWEMETARLWLRQPVDDDISSRVEIPRDAEENRMYGGDGSPKTFSAEEVRAVEGHDGAKQRGDPVVGHRGQSLARRYTSSPDQRAIYWANYDLRSRLGSSQCATAYGNL